MSSNPSLNWSKLQNVYYNIRTCYDDLSWSIDNLYSNYVIAFSPNTTLMAIASKNVPHPNLIEIYSNSGNKIWSVVYNSSYNDYIQSFHFTSDEDLIIIVNNGKYRHYYDLMGNFNEYNFLDNLTSMDNLNSSGDSNLSINSELTSPRVITNLENNELEEVNKIIEVKSWGNLLIILLDTRFIVTDLNSFTNYEISLKNYNVNDITTFDIQNSQNRHDESITVHLGYKKSILSIIIDFGLTNYEIIDQELTDGPFDSVSVSPNGQLISLYNKWLKKIFVISNKFDQILLEYDTSNESSSPYQIEWCGNDAIVLAIKDEIKLVGPGQQAISFFYDLEDDEDFDLDNLLIRDDGKDRDASRRNDDDLHYTIPILQTSVDGLKIISANKVQFLNRVPETTVAMYQVGSSSPSSILADCIDKFSSNASKAHGNISLLKSDGILLKAMDDCLEVAVDEFSVEWQRRALKAVSFGKIYTDEVYNPDKFVSIVNTIKVLNQIREPELGLFLTRQQIDYIGGWEKVIQMLLRRNQYVLSLEIIETLKLENLKPLVHIEWCCYKIRQELDMSDLDLFAVISERLASLTKERVNYISVEKISNVAHEEGRNVLCKLLIDLEPSVTKKVGQLLRLDDLELALIKCFQAGNHDLATLILLYLQEKLTTSQFFKLLNQNESVWKDQDSVKQRLEKLDINVARTENMKVNGELIGHFWQESVAAKTSPQLLETYLKHEDKTQALNIIKVKEFLHHNKLDSETYYDAYKAILTKSMNRIINKRILKSLQRELQILDLQKKLGETYLADFYQEKSLSAILKRLILMHQIKPAKKIVSNFQMSQEKFWYLVLNTLMDRHEFDQVYEFAFGSSDATTGRSPIGFEPFVELGLQKGAPQSHISNYIKNSVKYRYDEKQ
ncbi:Vacuolar-like protein sorting VPS16 [Candida maltosa Xu316]|uniref:Probable vacuolar protein sorting-associated protein 16 homolog n=1 Tax=Candida maltosa (strain Xu316) TaxID=1245528 RepID=M3J4K6_CANMX|nr:Vacuolar-like protein sorting VPS16 [Candida maltosa Xu316]